MLWWKDLKLCLLMCWFFLLIFCFFDFLFLMVSNWLDMEILIFFLLILGSFVVIFSVIFVFVMLMVGILVLKIDFLLLVWLKLLNNWFIFLCKVINGLFVLVYRDGINVFILIFFSLCFYVI